MQVGQSKLSERHSRTTHVTPATKKAAWAAMLQVREQVWSTTGPVIVKSNTVARGKSNLGNDLIYDNEPESCIIAVEANSNNNLLGTGMPQARKQAEVLDIAVAVRSTGNALIFHARIGRADGIERLADAVDKTRGSISRMRGVAKP